MNLLRKIWIFACAVSIATVFSSCSMSSSNSIFQQIADRRNWKVFPPTSSRSLGEITTITTNGIVSDNLDIVLANESILAFGSLTQGVSFIALEDLNNPKGKVISYTGPNTGLAEDRFGFSGLAVHPDTDKMYAWYEHDIIDLVERRVVSTQAPDFTHSGYGTSAVSRFIIDPQGRFWIGTSNIQPDGSSRLHDENGLFRITVTGETSLKEEVLQYPVWHLYQADDDYLWASTYQGLYRIDAQTKHSVRFEFADSSRDSWYIEQVLEFNDELYAIAKNYFHDARGETAFELYKIDVRSQTMQYVCDITNDAETNFMQVRAFVYADRLMFRVGGSVRYLNSSKQVVETSIPGLGRVGFGEFSHCVVGDTLYSVGNFRGVSIFNGTEHTILTQATTAENLISDNIFTIHVTPNQDTVYIGPYIGSTFSRLSDDSFTNISFAYEEQEVSISSFFEYQGDTYVQGAGKLGKISNDSISVEAQFHTNGERSIFDPSGFVWTYPNFGAGTNGVLAMMNLDSFEIKRIKKPQGEDHYESEGNRSTSPSLFWDSKFDQRYHYNHVLPIPGSSDMMIAISEGTGDFRTDPHTLRYSHETNTFTKVPIADSSSEGIMYMAGNGEKLYGVARQKLFVLEGSRWVALYPILLGNDFRDMVIVENFAIIASGWNRYGAGLKAGFEIVDLLTGQSQFYSSTNIPMPSDAIFALASQQTGERHYRLWFGSNSGLAYCDITLP